MDILKDYIRWYSEFSFYDKPFTEVDNLVLSTLAYYQFDLKKTDSKPAQLKRCIKNDPTGDDFLTAVLESHRFGRMSVSDYVEIFDKKSTVQFAAMKFKIRDGLYYIAFRGTDNSIVGWREDFMMCYKKIESQDRAVNYLKSVIGDDEYYVGGHSKGGHLALYGTCHLDDEQLSHVKHIYNNDGPGLCPEVCDVKLIDRIRLRTTVIHPRYCVFGMFFSHDDVIPDTKIVKSSFSGIMEHDLVSWCIDCGELDLVGDFDPACLWIRDIADNWLKDVDPKDREKFADTVFNTFEADGLENKDEIFEEGIDGVEDLLKNMIESDTVKTAAKLPEKLLFGDFIAELRRGKLSKFINANQLVEGIVFVIVGLLMLILHENAMEITVIILLGGIVIFQFIYTFKKLKQSNWDFSRERTRVYILLIIATVFALIIVKEQAMFIVGCGIAGGWLLVIAYKSFLAVKESSAHDFAYFKNICKTVLYFGCGIAVMVTPAAAAKWIVLTLGTIMTIDGICTIVYSFIQANEKYAAKYSRLKDRVKHIKKNDTDDK
jgi:uncharacterized membrane protein HdeD (DUF308 family)